MPCDLSPLAEAGLREIGDYIAQDNPKRAETFIGELVAHGEKIARMPTAYAAREELAPGLRSCARQRSIIFFRVVGNMTRIERILSAARDMDAIDFDA